jgi:spore maturation protein SpmA
VLNGIFIALIAGAVIAAVFSGTMGAVTTDGIIGGARTAVMDVAIPLIGQMALWLGFMRVLRDAGVMRSIARGLAPIMTRLFPDVPAEHPAMGAMIMNIAANMLGLGNAATPFGLKAMAELNRLNRHPGVATNAMVLFLAINTSGVAVLPLGVIAIRASLGAENAGGIVLPSILATLCSTLVAIAAVKWLQRRPGFAVERYAGSEDPGAGPEEPLAGGLAKPPETEEPEMPPASGWRLALMLGVFAVVLVGAGRHFVTAAPVDGGFETAKEMLSSWLLPTLLVVIAMFGFSRRVKVYESVVKGAREGFEIVVMIIPFLVAIIVAIAMFRASGLMELLIGALAPVTSLVGFPAEALPMALIRPLSGSGAMGVMTETMITYGPDSFVGFLVSVLNGSTETTFYVLAVYLGSVQVRAARHAVAACLLADATAVAAATLWSRLFFS